MVSILLDIIDQYTNELKPNLRQGLKQMINRSVSSTRRFIREIDKVMNEENCEKFGIQADEMRRLLDEIYYNNHEVKFIETD